MGMASRPSAFLGSGGYFWPDAEKNYLLLCADCTIILLANYSTPFFALLMVPLLQGMFSRTFSKRS